MQHLTHVYLRLQESSSTTATIVTTATMIRIKTIAPTVPPIVAAVLSPVEKNIATDYTVSVYLRGASTH